MNGKVTICTWMHCDNEKETNTYPQVGKNSSDNNFQAVYWRCIVDLFASSLKVNAGVDHVFFTNMQTIPNVDGYPVSEFLKTNNIKKRTLPYLSKIPRIDYNAWGCVFYMFDILKNICDTATCEDDIYVLLDTDCIFVRPITRLVNLIQNNGIIGCLNNHYSEKPLNGITDSDMKDIYREFEGVTPHGTISNVGGEWFGAKVSEIRYVRS